MSADATLAPAPAAGNAAANRTWLRITEVFVSIQGEARDAGWPTQFIRLTGCPLRCTYCDSEYAFYGGEKHEIDDLVTGAKAAGVRHVCVTGGEPLAQRGCRALLAKLCDAGLIVSLETSGALSVADIDPRVSRVVDLKTPGSGEMHRNRLDNLPLLTPHDQLKFVITSRADYEWSRDFCIDHRLADRLPVWFSPSHGQIRPADLADWILADRLPVRFQLQLHKQLWGDVPGR